MSIRRNVCLLPSQTGSLDDIRPYNTPIEMLVGESRVVRAPNITGIEVACFRQQRPYPKLIQVL